MNGVIEHCQKMRPAMGTFCVIAAGGAAEMPEAAVEKAFTALRLVEQRMHPTRQGSDLAQLATQSGRLVPVHAFTWEVLALARQINELSAGCFDPCLPQSVGGMQDIELLDGSRVICHRPVTIDLGGIAKGYAVDQAVTALRDAGCDVGWVNAGGDMRAFGDREERVAIKFGADIVATPVLCERALAVSDATNTNRPVEHRGYYSRREHCVRRYRQTAIAANTAAVADALTKCALFCDDATLTTLLRHFDAEIMLLR